MATALKINVIPCVSTQVFSMFMMRTVMGINYFIISLITKYVFIRKDQIPMMSKSSMTRHPEEQKMSLLMLFLSITATPVSHGRL